MTDFWYGKKVLVTGAGGFIGSHLVEKLVSEGAQVKAFVRYNSRGDPGLLGHLPAEVQNAAEIVAGDLCDLSAIEMAMKEVQVVYHLGALIAIPYSYLHPAEVIKTNVLGTLNVLLAARAAGVERLIHTSTSEVYGTALQVPITEDHPLQGQSPYSASKIGADKIAESFYCAYDLPVVTIRPFNTYGPRQSARAVIPTIITQVLAGGKVRIGNLETRRDFTYVGDTVSGFLRGGEATGVEGQTFNLGTGSEISIRDLLEHIGQIAGRTIDIEVDPQRLRPTKSEVQRLLSDNTRARQALAWSPAVPLADGLECTYEWIREHQHIYQPGVYAR
jgi:NAD dependent epimerase/dehydratase